METAIRSGNIRTKHAIPCQNLFRRITGRVEQRGMKVNTAKTAMLCMSDASSYEAASYINGANGERISSGDSLKVLGFHFSKRPTVHAHVEALRKRFRR